MTNIPEEENEGSNVLKTIDQFYAVSNHHDVVEMDIIFFIQKHNVNFLKIDQGDDSKEIAYIQANLETTSEIEDSERNGLGVVKS